LVAARPFGSGTVALDAKGFQPAGPCMAYELATE